MTFFSRVSFVLIFLQALLAGRLSAQANLKTGLKTLSVNDGLPQSFISALAQDKAGFIWIGTRDGLARYDGNSFKTFYHLPQDSSTIANNIISSFIIDRDDRLWIEFESGETDVFNTRTEKVFHLDRDPLFGHMRYAHMHDAIFADSEGLVWVAGPKDGLYHVNFDRHQCTYYSNQRLGLQGGVIKAVTQNRDYNIVIITEKILVGISSAKSGFRPVTLYHHLQPKLADDYILNAISRRNGEIFMINPLYGELFNPKTKQVKVITIPLNTNYLRDMTLDAYDNIYIPYGTRIYKFDRRDSLSVIAGNLPSVDVQSLLADNSGTLWAGINTGGIMLFDLRMVQPQVFIYRKNFGMDVLTGNLHVPPSEVDNSNFSRGFNLRATPRQGGGFWLQSDLDRIKHQLILYGYYHSHICSQYWDYDASLKDYEAWPSAIAASASGKLWGVSTSLQMIRFEDPKLQVSAPIAINKLYYNRPKDMLIDGESKFWITTDAEGLYYHNNNTGLTLHYEKSDRPGSLPTNSLLNLINDPRDKNYLWIASQGGGLIKFNKSTGRSRVYTTADGLPDNMIYAIYSDAKGLLWGSTNKGLFSFNPKTLAITVINAKDGLIENEFNASLALELSPDSLFFGGLKGYTLIIPSKLSTDSFRPSSALTAIKINNAPADYGTPGSPFSRPINSMDTISLSYSENFLGFEFAGLEFNRIGKLQYRYRLKGYDKKWVNSGFGTQATYTKLPPGTYKLLINCSNASGIWSDKIKVLTVIITPPFWLTWWFIVLVSLLFLALSVFLYRARVHNIRLQEQQKSRFELEAYELEAQALRAQMNPHFIFNCLNSIKYLIQKNDQEEAINYLTIFAKLIRSQLNNTNKEISLAMELETCKLYLQLEQLRFKDKIKWIFDISEQVDKYSLMLPPLLLQPFVENAVWHGLMPKDEGGSIKISIKDKDQFIDCEIDDDGIGRTVAQVHRAKNGSEHESKGMHLIRERLELHNRIPGRYGRINIIDKQNDRGESLGTLVVVSLKKQME